MRLYLSRPDAVSLRSFDLSRRPLGTMQAGCCSGYFLLNEPVP